jgi:AcrR family transcriptional regulator
MSETGRNGAGVQDGTGSRSEKTGRPDRRVQRTHRALREALVQLIRERGWDNVSVRDVCERADIGRSTFYVHFADKEELLVTGFSDLRTTLRAHLEPAKGEPLGFSMALLEHAREYKELYRALVGRRTAAAVQEGFLGVVRELVTDDLVRAGMSPNAVPGIAVSYVAGAFWHVLVWWLDQRSPPPASDVAAMFKRMTLPVLRVVQQHPQPASGGGEPPRRASPRR